MTRKTTVPPPPPDAFDAGARRILTLTDEAAYLTTCDRGQPAVTIPVQIVGVVFIVLGLAE